MPLTSSYTLACFSTDFFPSPLLLIWHFLKYASSSFLCFYALLCITRALMLLLFSMALEQCLTGLFSSLSSMTQPDFAVVSFPDFLCLLFFTIGLILIMAIQNVFISFSSPNFLMGLIDLFPKNKHGQEQLDFWFFLDLKYGLLATFWESRVLGAEDGHSGRQLLFCSLCFQPLPDGTFFPIIWKWPLLGCCEVWRLLSM